jgi:phosphohistidine phosphatase
MDLYIIRHGIAVEAGAPGFEHDSQRPLTEKGREKMQSIATGLRALGVDFDQILSSPYLRAWETAKILADVFKIKDKLAFSEYLVPMDFVEQLIDEIIEKYPVGSLAVVGHEPTLSALISTLLAGNPDLMINMKKGGVCCLKLDLQGRERRAMLEWLLNPAQLIKLGD